MNKAVIIGSGVAGLASAIRLSVQGYEVEVFERNAYPGGKLSYFEQDGFAFDAGPSLFTRPALIEELFALAGEDIEAYFNYERVPLACTYFFENGKTIQATADRQQFATNMQEQLGEQPESLHSYLDASKKTYENIGTFFLDHSLHKRSTYLNKGIFKAIKASKASLLFNTLNGVNKAHFKTPEAVQLFNRYATYNGSDPYKAPGMLSLIPHLEMNEGTFYPKGGMISITNALYQLAQKKGVRFHFDAPVQRIIRHEGKAVGVVVNDANHFADVVVSNMDVYLTYKHLLKDDRNSRKVLKQERSSSAFIFYWGIDRNFDQLGLHNIFFSKDYQQEFHHLFNKKAFFNDPTVYINITAKMEAGMAPQGKENWFVMVNAPANVGQYKEAMTDTIRTAVIEKLNRMLQTDIQPLIATEAVLDPVLIESRTASHMGSLYGTSSNSRLAAFFRHPNFSKKIKGLYFVGGSVHPGGGIPLCLQSAKIMAGLVAKDNRKKQQHH